MFWTNTKRIIRSGYRNFVRSGFTSIASVLIMTVTLFVITSLIFVQAALTSSLDNIKNKVDVTVYFVPGADESVIKNIQSDLEKIPEVKSIDYTNEDDALVNYKAKHANDQMILQVFDILDSNPLGASLSIKAKDTGEYQNILNYFNNDNTVSKGMLTVVDTIDYSHNKIAIDRLTSIINGAYKLGFALSLILIFISIIITFNTLRIVIYMSREEINVMKLVGAANKFISGPFVITGILVGVFSSIITIILFWPVSYWLGLHMTDFLNINLFSYYKDNFFQLLFICLLSGVIIGSISSVFAIHRYLRK